MIFSALTAALGGGAAAGAAGAAGAGAAAGAGGLATSIGGIAGALGTAGSLVGTGLQYKAAQEAAAAGRQAENVRKAQMELETVRQRRQVIRQAVRARSEALAVATQQGAAQGSGLQGGFGQISGQTGENITGLNNSAGLGNAMFAANRRASNAQTLGSIGQGVGSLSGALVSNQNEIGRLGANLLS